MSDPTHFKITQMIIDLLPSIHVSNFLTSEEIDNLSVWIRNCAVEELHVGNIKGDRFEGKLISNYVKWDYYDDNSWSKKIRDLLDQKFQKVLPESQVFFHTHILESIIPYQLHSDFDHCDLDSQISKYTFLIPLENYNSRTVVFNEYLTTTNEFEKYKQQQPMPDKLKLDPKFCMNNLSHLYPGDLKYLSLKETFEWRKGDLFAMDRRYIHCSDNFNKNGIFKKLGIVIWSGVPIT